jgi:hypothetical protein
MNLPNLQDALLDDATVDALFHDVSSSTQLLEIVFKGSAEQMTPEPAEASLARARTALRERTVFGVQLRYRFGATEWWDTLIPMPGGVRLVRIDHGAAVASPDGLCDESGA